MSNITEHIWKFILALLVSIYFGPIIMIISIIGYMDISGLKIDLRPHKRAQRLALCCVGMMIWLSIYIPLLLLLLAHLPSLTHATFIPTPTG